MTSHTTEHRLMVDLARKYGVIPNMDYLMTVEGENAELDAKARQELETRMQVEREQADLDRQYSDNSRAVTIDTGYTPSRRINKGTDEATGEPVWFNLYKRTVDAVAKSGQGEKR